MLVSLPTLSNQDRELQKEVVLSACEHADSRILLFAALSCSYCCDFTCWCREEGGLGLGQEVNQIEIVLSELVNQNPKISCLL